jgi:hypothetical protein
VRRLVRAGHFPAVLGARKLAHGSSSHAVPRQVAGDNRLKSLVLCGRRRLEGLSIIDEKDRSARSQAADFSAMSLHVRRLRVSSLRGACRTEFCYFQGNRRLGTSPHTRPAQIQRVMTARRHREGTTRTARKEGPVQWRPRRQDGPRQSRGRGPTWGPGAMVRTARRGGDGTRGGASPCPAELIAGRRRLACQLSLGRDGARPKFIIARRPGQSAGVPLVSADAAGLHVHTCALASVRPGACRCHAARRARRVARYYKRVRALTLLERPSAVLRAELPFCVARLTFHPGACSRFPNTPFTRGAILPEHIFRGYLPAHPLFTRPSYNASPSPSAQLHVYFPRLLITTSSSAGCTSSTPSTGRSPTQRRPPFPRPRPSWSRRRRSTRRLPS